MIFSKWKKGFISVNRHVCKTHVCVKWKEFSSFSSDDDYMTALLPAPKSLFNLPPGLLQKKKNFFFWFQAFSWKFVFFKTKKRRKFLDWKERMKRGGGLCVCVCRGWFLVCLMDNVVTRFCTRWVIRRSGFLIVVVRTFVKLVWPFSFLFFLISNKSNAAQPSARRWNVCVSLFFFYLSRGEKKILHIWLFRVDSFFFLKSRLSHWRNSVFWLVGLPPVQQQFLSRLFSKIFFEMANGHNNLKKKKQEDRAGPSSDHTRSRTHGFVKGQHNERRTGGGGGGCWNCYQTRSSLVPRRPFLMNSCPVIFAAANVVVWLWRSNRASTSAAAQSPQNSFFFVLNGYVALCFVLSLFIFPFGVF